MSKDAISQVLNAEAEANAIRERAAREATALVESCEQACAAESAREVEKAKAELEARL